MFLRRYLDEEHLSNNALAFIVDDVDLFVETFADGIAKWIFVREPVKQANEIRLFTVSEMKGLESDMVLYIHRKNSSDNENYIAYTRAKYYLLELVRDY